MSILIKIFAILLFSSALQGREAPPPIQTHYHGATLFVGPTAKSVSTPQAVTNYFEYLDIYGVRSFQTPDRMALSAWLFFQNGGEKLYVFSPDGQSASDYAQALRDSQTLEVDLVAIPAQMDSTTRKQVMDALIQHVENSPNRFGLIDPPKGASSNQLLNIAHDLSTTNAAMYAPWIQSLINQTSLPPSAAVAGVISRIDRKRGVFKSPAGTGAIIEDVRKLENGYTTDQLGQLNQAGVNIIRRLDATKPPMIMGARILKDPTTVDSPYIVGHRFLKLLKYSIKRSLNGAESILVGSQLAKRYQKLIKNYLDGYFRRGAFQGRSAREAYFTQCFFQDPQITCEVGVSILKPAEFNIFRLSLD